MQTWQGVQVTEEVRMGLQKMRSSGLIRLVLKSMGMLQDQHFQPSILYLYELPTQIGQMDMAVPLVPSVNTLW